MKKNLYGILLVLAVLSILVTPAYASVERSLTLESIVEVSGKGVVFTFNPQGKFEASELSGHATINYETFALHFQVNDFGEVKGMAERGLSRYTGQIATGEVAGYPFSGLIRSSPLSTYCYDVYQKINSVWKRVGETCGSVPAREGDWILYGSSLAVYHANGPAGSGVYVEGSLAAPGHRYGRGLAPAILPFGLGLEK